LLDLVPEEHRDFNDVWKIHEIEGKIVIQSYEKLFIYDGERIEVINPVDQFHFSFNISGVLLVPNQANFYRHSSRLLFFLKSQNCIIALQRFYPWNRPTQNAPCLAAHQ